MTITSTWNGKAPLGSSFAGEKIFQDACNNCLGSPFSSLRNPAAYSIPRRHWSFRIESSAENRPRLIIPGGGSGGANYSSSGASLTSMSSSLYLPFLRPTPEAESENSDLSIDAKLEILRERRGLWHEYASLIPSLNRSGLTSSFISESTGMTGVEQNTVVVAAQVYNTLKEFGVEEHVLGFFDIGGADVLYELRVLPVDRRKIAAEYVVENALDGKGAKDLARAMKEFERRKREKGREAFSSSPADCLAFEFYRQSKEVRGDSETTSLLKKALEYAVTQSAIDLIQQALKGEKQTEVSAETIAKSATISTVRLRPDETQARPIPVLGDFEEINYSALRNAPSPSISGPFRLFNTTLGCQWAAIPGWGPLLSMNWPVGVLLSNVDLIPSLKGKKIEGPALLVVDTKDFELNESFYYVGKTGDSEKLELVPGFEAQEGREVFGKIVFALFPPDPNAEKDEDVDDWE